MVCVINVNFLFLFIAGISFLGFIVNALFDKLRITNILPLMIIGLIVGPILGIINTAPGSTFSSLAPLVGAIAISFVLFEAGLNINIFRLSKVIVKATKFTFVVEIITGILLSLGIYLALRWSIVEALIAGFALAGPSSVAVPTLVKLVDAPPEIKTSLMYEGVATDSLSLIVPLFLFSVLAGATISPSALATDLLIVIVGSVVLGVVLAVLWLYILNKFRRFIRMYSWMLTISIVLATYGLSEVFGLSGALTIFAFGLAFSNIGNNAMSFKNTSRPKAAGSSAAAILEGAAGEIIKKYLTIPNINYIKNYQREIAFFTSTFFFVYIGMIFSISALTILPVVIAILLTAIIVLLRMIFIPIIGGFIPKDQPRNTLIKRVISFDVARGFSPAVIATVAISMGIVIPGFADLMFLVIFVTNLVMSIGIFASYKSKPRSSLPVTIA